MIELNEKLKAYEAGDLEASEVLILFAELIETGKFTRRTRPYQKMANSLIEKGLISKKGIINWDLYNSLLEKV